ncbi:hypothetical protein ME1_00005 [Bartonella vinsonii subsp. arupensis OK-94-513]|uniref:Uncharacterized protein n=2 Tax=Bartonella vinsonii subsp. arupensis TaxID=110578 RepID=J1K173_BARVI|nr:hypothetical protein ME1_00005 [Bartonella vinsonii subsp. arupensis OK-94-513]EJF97562.1 hypothetical protein MEI_01256 [Bartonella vinsonii subsp. arupensis Pm136co]
MGSLSSPRVSQVSYSPSGYWDEKKSTGQLRQR